MYKHLGPERVTLWDSKARGWKFFLIKPFCNIFTLSAGGRPDTMELIREIYKSWNAEVVFITSNFQGNREMMEGCKEAGIPAFVRVSSATIEYNPLIFAQGTLWDF